MQAAKSAAGFRFGFCLALFSLDHVTEDVWGTRESNTFESLCLLMATVSKNTLTCFLYRGLHHCVFINMLTSGHISDKSNEKNLDIIKNRGLIRSCKSCSEKQTKKKDCAYFDHMFAGDHMIRGDMTGSAKESIFLIYTRHILDTTYFMLIMRQPYQNC